MDYTALSQDNDFQKWFKYQPLDAQIVRYAKDKSSIVAAGQKIMDVYNVILSILVYTLFSRMFDLMQPPVVKHSIAVA